MATNYASATYTEIVDMQTINGKTTVIGIHTPQGGRIRNYLRGFFDQFRFFKYNGISSMVAVNPAGLPVDPLGLTAIQGTTDQMDPRDSLNPILFHGCHGEALNTVLDTIYTSRERTLSSSGLDENALLTDNENSHVSDSLLGVDVDNFQEFQTYYAALTDRTWKKFGIQSGVHLRGLHPRVWKMARNSPLLPVSGTDNVNLANAGLLKRTDGSAGANFSANVITPAPAQGTGSSVAPIWNSSNVEDYGTNDEVPINVQRYDQYMTNGTAPLGWLPTAQTTENGAIAPVQLPKLFMGVLVLPPSYNVEQFLRFRITHSFSFRGFTASLGNMQNTKEAPATPESRPAYFNWIDYTVSNNKTESSSVFNEGATFDVIGGASRTISDGVA